MRLLILKLSATLALWMCGCSMPAINVPTPQPVAPPSPQQVELKISVGGDGKITVAGGADVNVKNASQPSSPAVERCDCGCEKESCRCSSRSADKRVSAADTTTRSGPPIVPPRKVYECRAGVCGWYDVPTSTTRERSSTAGKIRVFIQTGNPACDAMRAVYRNDGGFEFVTGTPPAINGNRWWPTAVKPDGAAWTPGAGGWHSGSPEQLSEWLRR